MLTNDCIAHLLTTQTELQGHTAVTQVLIEKGAELDIANTIDGHTPLHLAYLRGHSEVVQLLITAGASETVLDKKGNTPMVNSHRIKNRILVYTPVNAGCKAFIEM
jgi:ankyrin repeat protein